MGKIEWLPPLIMLEAYDGDVRRYLEVLYDYFKKDFICSGPMFQNRRVSVSREKDSDGKEKVFWHIISEGSTEEKKVPPPRRCERIRWPRKIIEHGEESAIRVWPTKRKRKGRRKPIRICLWLAEEYLVVLIKEPNNILLLTAYPTDRAHTKRKLRKEYENFKRKDAAI